MQNKEIQKKWEHGKKATIHFYHMKSFWKFKQFNFKFKLADYFGPMIGDKKEVSIADLGAGIVATTGSTWPNVKINLYPSDALADEFNDILIRKDKRWGNHPDLETGYKPLFPIVKQNMENLSYEDNFFDIVHCANALDHCADPFKAIKEMYRVCKLGGWIHLRHFADNAESQRYHGLHQWNISSFQTDPFIKLDCLFKSLSDKFWLSDCIPGFKTIEEDGMIISTFHKSL